MSEHPASPTHVLLLRAVNVGGRNRVPKADLAELAAEAGLADVSEPDRAYIAMEFVRGLPLNEWNRERAPTVREKLEVFAKVCDAVAQRRSR